MANKKIYYDIEFRTNNSTLDQVKKDLREIQNMKLSTFVDFDRKAASDGAGNISQEYLKAFNEVKKAAGDVEQALVESFNPKLNTANISEFEARLKKMGHTGGFASLEKSFAKIGVQGTTAFRNITTQILTAERATKQTSKIVDKLATSLKNTISWSISSSVLNAFTGTIRDAWNYAIKLDTALNDIRIVTEKSSEEMAKFAKNANKMAKELSTSTTAYAKASLIYYQQGLGEQDVKARTDVTVKAANVTGQSAAEVSEQLTAVWNGYKVVAEDAEKYVDKLAAVAASTAADLEELSEGMSKVASGANAMGVDIDQLTAQLSTIVSVTRQDASSVGTALKTIFARMGDLKVDGVDEFGVSLGDVSGTLKQVGIEVLDQQGNLRDMGVVMEEVAGKWGTWTEAQQQAIAIAMAGKRQYNNLLALFENWDMYESALSTSKDSEGTLQKQQDIYKESTKAHLNELRASWESLFDSFIDNESMNKLIDVFGGLIKVVDGFVQGIGGGGTLILGIASVLTNMLSTKIGPAIARIMNNFSLTRDAAKQQLELSRFIKDLQEKGVESTNKQVELKKLELKYSKLLSEEDRKRINSLIQEATLQENEKDIYNEKYKDAKDRFAKMGRGEGSVIVQTDEEKNASKGKYFEKDVAKDLQTNANNLITESESIKKKSKNKDEETQKEIKSLRAKKGALTRKYGESAKDSDEYKELNKQIKALQKPERQLLQTLKEKHKLTAEQLHYVKEMSEKTDLSVEDEEKLLQIVKEVAAADKEAAQFLENAKESRENQAKAEKDLEVAIKQEQKEARNKALGQGFSQLASAAMGAFAAVMAVNNAINVLNDDSATTGEKISAVISTTISILTTMLPLIISSIKAIRTASSVAIEATRAQGVSAGVSVQAAFGWITLVLMSIMAIIMIVMALLKKSKKETELDKAKKDLDNARESAELTKKSFDNLKKSYQDLLSAISEYKDAKKALDELREGTDEWKAAIEEVNNQALDLLDTYPILAEYLTRNENGMLEISEEGLDKVVDEQRKLLEGTQAAVILTKKGALDAENKYLEEETKAANISSRMKEKDLKFGSSVSYNKNTGLLNLDQDSIDQYGYVYNYKDVQKSKALTEDIANNAILQQERYFTIKNGIASLNLNNLESDISEMDDEAITNFINSMEGLGDEDLKNALINLAETTKENRDTIANNTKASDNLRKVYLENLTGNKYDAAMLDFVDKNGEIKTGVSIGESTFGKLATKEGTKNSKYTLQLGEDDVANKDDEKKTVANTANEILKKAYGPEYTNWISYKAVPADLTAQQLFSTWQIELKSGNTTTLEQAEIMIQNEENRKKAEKLTKDFTSARASAEAKGVSGAAAFFDTSVSKDYFSEEGKSFKDFTDETWTDATLAEMVKIKGAGLENFDTELFNTYEEYFKEQMNTALGNLSGIVNYSSLTLEEANQLRVTSNQFKTAGASDALERLLVEKSGEQVKEINEILAGIDLTDMSSVGQTMVELIDKGLLSETDNLWTKLFEDVANGNAQWISDSQKVKDNLATINKIAKDIKIGDIISEEEFKELQAINPMIARSFVKTANGYVAVASDIEKQLKSNYQSLAGISASYDAIKKFYGNGARQGDAYAEFVTTNDVSKFFKNLNIRSEADFNSNKDALSAMGAGSLTWEQYKALMSGDESVKDFGIIIAKKINQALLDAKNGLLDGKDAVVTFGTLVANSWTEFANEVEATTAGYADVEKYWKAQYAAQLGLSKVSEKVSATVLEEQIKRVTKLEQNRYQTIENDLKKLDSQIEKTFGAKKIDLLEEREEKLDDAIDIAKENLETAKASVVFYNSALDVDENKSIKELQEDQLKTEKGSDEWNNYQLLIDAKQKVIDLNIELDTKLQEKIDAQLEKLDAKLQIEFDFADAKIQFNEFKSKYLKDNVIDLFRDPTAQEQLDLANDNYFAYEDKLKSSLGKIMEFSDQDITNATVFENFKQATEQAQQSFEEMFGTVEEMLDSYTSMQEEIMQMYSDQIEKLSNVNSLYTSSAELLKLIGGRTGEYSNQIQEYFNAIQINSTKSLALAQEQLAAAQTAYEKDYEKATEEQKKMLEENLQNAATAVLENATAVSEAAASAFEEKFSASIDKAFGGSLEKFSEEWERELYFDDRYLDEVNEAYSIDEFKRKIQKSIDETDSYSAQKKLNQLREQELKFLEEKDKLTQADLDRANARYELELKRIALEEAQRTATKMKLTRDASGNYSYQYVADQDAVSKAQEELAKAENDLYNLNKSQEKETIEMLSSQYQQAMSAIGAAQTEEEKNALYEHYFGNEGVITLLEQDLSAIGAQGAATGTYSSQYKETIERLMNIDKDSIQEEFNSALTDFSETMDLLAGEGGTLFQLFGKDGSLVKTLNDLSANIKNADEIDVSEKLNNASGILTTVFGTDGLASKLQTYANDIAKILETNVNITGVEANTIALNTNTFALQGLTNAIFDQLDAKDGKIDNVYGDFKKNTDGNWILEQNAGE